MPALAGFLQQMIKGPGYEPGAPGQPARPVSRLDAFENFLGNFLNSFSTGMSNAGTGPAANARGFGSAVQAPYQRQMQQYQAGQQQQAQQSQLAAQAAETQKTQAQTAQMGQMVTLPNGVQMPLSLAQKVYPAMISGQARVAAAGAQKRFMTTPFGVYDTQLQKYAGGSGAGPTALTTINQEMADQYGLPKDLIGKQVKLTDLAALERGAASQITPVQGSEGPALANKVTGEVRKLGLGSPAANAIAQGKLSLQQAAFERDTFGQLFGDTAKKYPSLISLADENGNAIGWKSPTAPTANIKTQAQQAQDLSKLFKDVKAEIGRAQQAGKIGPGAGRINEFLTGKVGAEDPEFARLRMLGALTLSGTLKAHFGARGGGEMIYKDFENRFNTGKMTMGDLNAALDGMSTFMGQYAKRVATTGDKNNPPATAPNGAPQISFTPTK